MPSWSSNKFEDLVLVFKGSEVQREIGRLESAITDKVMVGEWKLLAATTLREELVELEEHMDVEMEVVFHWESGGRFWIQV